MGSEPWMTGPPARIMLATDLSPRCDRALDRSVQLARQWGAELVALTAVEQATHMPDQTLEWMGEPGERAAADVARRVLARELRRHRDLHTTIELAPGPVIPAIQERSRALGCPLVVTGVARDEPFGRMLTGTTTEALARSGPPMLLVVRERPHDGYHSILVATDFSDASRHALLAAMRLLPESPVVLYHAYEPPFSGLADRTARQSAARTIAGRDGPAFLARCGLSPQEHQRVKIVVEAGPIEMMAARYVRDHHIHLAVAGNHGASGIVDLLLGSSAAKLLQWIPCDLLLVRAPAS